MNWRSALNGFVIGVPSSNHPFSSIAHDLLGAKKDACPKGRRVSLMYQLSFRFSDVSFDSMVYMYIVYVYYIYIYISYIHVM